MGYVDRVAVKVWPDTRTFDREMRQKTQERRKTIIQAVLDAAEARAELKKLEGTKTVADLDVRIDKARAKLAQLKKDLTLDQNKSIEINADIREARTRITQLRADLAGVEDKDAKVAIRADIKEASKRVAELRAKLATLRDHKFEVQAATTKARKELHDLEKDRKVVFQAQVDSLNARRELIMLARKRIAEIWVRVNKSKAMADIKEIMAGLTGLNMLKSWRQDLTALFANLPQTVLRIGAVGSALAALVTPAMSALSALAPLGASLKSILPIALAAVPLFGAFALQLGVLGMAFYKLKKSTNKAAQDFRASVVSIFGKLRQPVQTAFFDKSGFSKAFVSMMNELRPQINRGVVQLAREMGGIGTVVTKTLASALKDGRLTQFLDNLNSAISAGMPGLRDFVHAFTNLGTTGSEVFPDIARWINDIGARFRAWTERTDAETMLRDAAAQVGYLWQATKNLGSVIAGIFRAMDTGKSTGMAQFADTLGRVREIVWSSGFQTAMRTVFTGAAAGAEALREALGPIGDALEQLSPLIGNILGTLGKAAANALVGIANALAQPAAQNGIQAALTGISTVMASMPWDALGQAVGSIGQAIGQIAPLIVILLQSLAPLLPVLIDAIAQLIPPLTDIVVALLPSLVDIITALVPVISALAPVIEALAPLVQVLAEILAALLVPALTVLADGIQLIAPLFDWWVQVISDALVSIKQYLNGDYVAALATLRDVTARVMGDIGGLISGMASAALGVISAWAGSLGAQIAAAWNRAASAAADGVNNVVRWVASLPARAGAALAGIGGILGNAGRAMIQGFWNGAMAVWNNVKSWIGGLADWIAQHKGPLTYDYRLLQPAGRKIIGGLRDSMASEWNSVEALVSDFAPRISSTVRVSGQGRSSDTTGSILSPTALAEAMADALAARGMSWLAVSDRVSAVQALAGEMA